jgi:predicted DNA-binding protein
MPRGKPSINLGAVVSPELKERLKEFADLKRWSMSQAAAVLIEEGLERYEEELESKSGKT